MSALLREALAGWKIERASDPVFKAILVQAPNGYTASVTRMDRNPSNILYMLAEAILASPPTQAPSAASPEVESLPPLPPVDLKHQLPYEAIRYVAGFPAQYVEKYAIDYARAAIAATGRPATEQKEQQMKVTDEMVSRFLCWKLPDDFAPDAGITFKRVYNEKSPFGVSHHEPVGTNLFTAPQARAMLEHVLASSPSLTQAREGEGASLTSGSGLRQGKAPAGEGRGE